jgi:hypothetical protein
MRLRSSISLLLLPLLLTAAALAQSVPTVGTANLISVRLLSADSGQPMPNLKVGLYGDTGGKPLPITFLGDLYEVDITGQVTLRVGDITTPTSHATDFTACTSLNLPPFDIKQIQAKGISPHNKCSKRTHPAAPGELVIFIRRTHWWERWRDTD